MSDTLASEQSIFMTAIELRSLAEREAFLAKACAGDDRLRAEVDELLAAHDRLGTIDSPTLAVTADQGIAERPGTDIGPYKLLEQIGEGGFGIVFRAEQERPVSRNVALKVLKPGMDSRQVVARFEAERQALALMDHPNIAHIYDGGTTPAGRPYFVMELVRGVPITDYCDQSQLAIPVRLELFIRVCQAVQHAHTKGVIHRDLKPSNVLVTLHDDKATPKVIDFGVAKALGQRLTDKTLVTGFAQMIGTPLYMSPEQAAMSGLDVDTRSDVYALGVLLYELLTGKTPFDGARLRKAGYDEMRRIIREEEPSRPSSRISNLGQAASTLSANRHSDPRRLSRLLRGELDWVVMKCLEKNRTRRYETVDALAMDVQRYLSDEPVQACPPTVGYRVGKLARRNKVVLGVCSVLLTAVLVVAGSIGWAARDRSARQKEMELERAARDAESDQERELLIEQAALSRDSGNWSEARAAAGRATRLMVQLGSDRQRERLDGIVRDLDMAARVEAAAVRRLLKEEEGHDEHGRRTDEEYYSAFRDYGIDLKQLDAASAAERVRASAIREVLLFGLDDWHHDRKARAFTNVAYPTILALTEVLKGEAERFKPVAVGRLAVDLRAVADLADDDTVRQRVRRFVFPRGGEHGVPMVDRQRMVEEFAASPAAVELGPKSAILLAACHANRDRALRILLSAQERHPTDLGLLLALVFRLTHPGLEKLEQAIGFLRAAVALRPESVALRTQLGRLLQYAGRWEESIAAFSVALRLNPADAKVHCLIGMSHRETGAFDQALQSINTAIALKPSQGSFYVQRGYTYARLGKWDLAARDYGWIDGWDSMRSESWLEFAAPLLLGGGPEAYARMCASVNQYVADMWPSREPAAAARRARINYLAARTLGLGQNTVAYSSTAVRLAEEAVATDRKAAWYLHTLGRAYCCAGEFDKAERSIRDSLAARPAWEANVCNWLALAIILKRRGKDDEAREWMNRSVRWIDDAIAKLPKGVAYPLPGMHAHDSLACYVLRREAEDLNIGGKK